ncbi:MAG: hypothetical protein H0X40_00050 [Chthoniobacterales bacterium]|nr:hypothetical protein [Chthoniobacterales bacterium]
MRRLSLLLTTSICALICTIAQAAEQNSAVTRFIFTDKNGKVESAQVISSFTGKSSYPFANTHSKLLSHLDPKLLRAATIADERAHAHSRSCCWRYVKEALLASGAVSSYPKTEYARQAGDELVSSFGFTRLAVRDPYQAPVGSVLVYGSGRSAGHVEIRTPTGFVSDFRATAPSRRPLIGIYAKMSSATRGF